MNIEKDTQNARIYNAIQDVRLYTNILAGSNHDEAERQFLKEHIGIAIDKVEALVNESSLLDDIKRITGERLARSIEPTFSPEAWTDEYLYSWLDQRNCVWLYTRKDWMDLNMVANGNAKHVQSLLIIYAADGFDIDTRYCIPTMAALKVQSLGYFWNKEEFWDNRKQPKNEAQYSDKYRAAKAIIKQMYPTRNTDDLSVLEAYEILAKQNARWDKELKSWVVITKTNI